MASEGGFVSFLLLIVYSAPVLFPAEMVNDGGIPITINEWENPCPISADWDGDGRNDLIVGVAMMESPAVTKYRYYRNLSDYGDPVFDGWEYILQSDGDTLTTALNSSDC